MKTIIFLALLSLSFAFIPKSLYRENLTVSDVVTRNAADFVKDTNSSDSSDYLVIEIYPDYSDWNNATNSTDSSDYLVIEIYPGDNNYNNTSFYNRSNLTGSDLESTNNVSLSHPSDGIVIESYIVEYNWTNITNSSDSSDYLVRGNGWNNTTFSERYNLTAEDVIAEITNATNNVSLSHPSDGIVIESYYVEYNWTNITNSSDSSDYLLIEIDFVDSDGNNITNSSDSSDYLDNTTFHERYNQIIADVIAGIVLNAVKDMNSSDSSDYTVMETHVSESNWTNITDSSDFSDYPVIEIDTDDSDWISIKPEIIELLKPIFMNFTEAYYEYLSENDSEVSLEDQLLYDDILTSIAQLFNETVEEKALFGNVTEKDVIIERNNTENQDGKNFIGSQ